MPTPMRASRPEEEAWPLLLMPQYTLAVMLIAAVVAFAYATIRFLTDMNVLLWPQEMAWVESQQASRPANGSLLGDDTVITLTRTRCYGNCPQYELKLFGSGRVEFHGESYVCEKAPAPTRVDPGRVKRLVDGMVASGFDHMRSQDEVIIDAATATLTLTRNGRSHAVRHQYHYADGTHRLLPMMSGSIEEVAGAAAWVGVIERFQRLCILRDGRRVPIEQVSSDYTIG